MLQIIYDEFMHDTTMIIDIIRMLYFFHRQCFSCFRHHYKLRQQKYRPSFSGPMHYMIRIEDSEKSHKKTAGFKVTCQLLFNGTTRLTQFRFSSSYTLQPQDVYMCQNFWPTWKLLDETLICECENSFLYFVCKSFFFSSSVNTSLNFWGKNDVCICFY